MNTKYLNKYSPIVFLFFSLAYYFLFERNIKIGIFECFWEELLAISFFINFMQFMLVAIFSNKVSENFKKISLNYRPIFAFIILYFLGLLAFVILVNYLDEWCSEEIYFVEVIFRSIVIYGMTWGITYPIKLVKIFI